MHDGGWALRSLRSLRLGLLLVRRDVLQRDNERGWGQVAGRQAWRCAGGHRGGAHARRRTSSPRFRRMARSLFFLRSSLPVSFLAILMTLPAPSTTSSGSSCEVGEGRGAGRKRLVARCVVAHVAPLSDSRRLQEAAGRALASPAPRAAPSSRACRRPRRCRWWRGRRLRRSTSRSRARR